MGVEARAIILPPVSLPKPEIVFPLPATPEISQQPSLSVLQPLSPRRFSENPAMNIPAHLPEQPPVSPVVSPLSDQEHAMQYLRRQLQAVSEQQNHLRPLQPLINQGLGEKIISHATGQDMKDPNGRRGSSLVIQSPGEPFSTLPSVNIFR